jgi:hypothetical protein
VTGVIAEHRSECEPFMVAHTGRADPLAELA